MLKENELGNRFKNMSPKRFQSIVDQVKQGKNLRKILNQTGEGQPQDSNQLISMSRRPSGRMLDNPGMPGFRWPTAQERHNKDDAYDYCQFVADDMFDECASITNPHCRLKVREWFSACHLWAETLPRR